VALLRRQRIGQRIDLARNRPDNAEQPAGYSDGRFAAGLAALLHPSELAMQSLMRLVGERQAARILTLSALWSRSPHPDFFRRGVEKRRSAAGPASGLLAGGMNM